MQLQSVSRRGQSPSPSVLEGHAPTGRSRGRVGPALLTPRGDQLYARHGFQTFSALREGLVERAAIGIAARSAAHLTVARPTDESLPASVPVDNLPIATWAIGRACQPQELAEKLAKSPFTFVVLVRGSAVAGVSIPAFDFLSDVAKCQELPVEERQAATDLIRDVLQERSVHSIGCRTHADQSNIFVALHKAKVVEARFDEFNIRSRGPDHGIHFGKLTLTLDQQRQKMSTVSVGLIDVRAWVEASDTDALVAWAILERIDMLTGFFGFPFQREWVDDFATRTRVISWTPMFQAITHKELNGLAWSHPSFYLLYGFYKAITVPETPADFTAVADLDIGGDLVHDMIRMDQMAEWERNDRGSALVHHLGHIKMKQPDWTRWFSGCFQTVIWLGTSTQGKGAGKRKGTCKGKGTGKGKGKDKGKGADQVVTAVAAQSKGAA